MSIKRALKLIEKFAEHRDKINIDEHGNISSKSAYDDLPFKNLRQLGKLYYIVLYQIKKVFEKLGKEYNLKDIHKFVNKKLDKNAPADGKQFSDQEYHQAAKELLIDLNNTQ